MKVLNNFIASQSIQTQINKGSGADDYAARTSLHRGDMTSVVSGPEMPTHLRSSAPLIPHDDVVQENLPQPNPFDKFNMMPHNDAPIQMNSGMADSLLNDNEVPVDVKERFWFLFHKDNVLTFLDAERQKQKMLSFDIMKIDALHVMPYYDYTFEKEMEFDVLRSVYETKLDRALGIDNGNIKNERIMLQSQFQEQRHINDAGESAMMKGGFFKRLFGKR